MTDFEHRLRAAMAAAAEPAPAGLLDGIHRRHRRHVRRVATACVAVVAVGIAGTLVTRGVLATGPAGGGSGGSRPGRHQPGGCAVQHGDRRAGHRAPGLPVQQRRDAGLPLESPECARWPGLVHLRPPGHALAQPPADRRENPCLSHGHRGPQRPHGRGHGGPFARRAVPVPGGFNNSGTPYTLSEGAPGLTLAGCPASPLGHHIPASYAPGLTMFWEGFVTDLRGCIPLEVRASPDSPPVRVTIAATDGGCGS